MTTALRLRLLPLCGLALLTLGGAPAPQSPAGARQAAEAPRYGGTFRVKGYQAPFNRIFDPALPAHYFIIEQLYDGLVRFDNRFNPVPALAEYWTASPDGSRIAYSANYDGNLDVYVVPTLGGLPVRVTYHGMADRMLDWYPDGRKALLWYVF